MSSRAVVGADVVDATIDKFTKLDKTGDRRSMQKLAQRLGREQPALLQYAAGFREEHGDTVGEAAVFYATLVWAVFDRAMERRLPRLTAENIDAAKEELAGALAEIERVGGPVHERVAPQVVDRQPDLIARIQALIEEDVREDAMTAECAAAIFPPTQVVIAAFEAALDGRRPGEHQGPVLREARKVGRNEPCPCGSGKKYKKCCGRAA